MDLCETVNEWGRKKLFPLGDGSMNEREKGRKVIGFLELVGKYEQESAHAYSCDGAQDVDTGRSMGTSLAEPPYRSAH